MQVLALMTEAFGARGGIQAFNRHWLRALAAEPASHVDVLATGGGRWTEPFIHQRSAATKARYVATAFSLAAERPDLLLCGHISLLPLAGWLARRSNIPLWLQLHGIECWQPPKRRWRQWGLSRVTLASAVSRYTRERFLSWSTLQDHQAVIVPNTVPDDCFGEADCEDIIGGPYLLSVGRLDSQEAYKGHDGIIAGMPKVLAQHPQLKFVVAGEGDDQARLEALAESHGVMDKVVFLGYVSRAQLLTLYRQAELFVMPSQGEGFGIVFLEALANGCPVLGQGLDGSADPLSLSVGCHRSGKDLAESILNVLDASSDLDRSALPDLIKQRFGLPLFEQKVKQIARQLVTR
ncbi:MAG: glycosyltransferase family 4 protein [Lysobacterales bacterium]